MPAYRQQHISAEGSGSGRRQKLITELARLRGDAQCQTQDVLAGSGQSQGSGEAHRDVVGACLIKPGNTSPTDGAASTDQPLQDLTSRMQPPSCREPCRAGKRLLPEPCRQTSPASLRGT
jgi:hypothetical protein